MHYSLDTADATEHGSATATDTTAADSSTTGSAGSGTNVPAAAATSTDSARASSTNDADREQEQCSMSDVDVAERFKQEGNAAFTVKDYNKALQLWGLALDSFTIASASTKVLLLLIKYSC
jgi:hypothetical protein